MLSKFRKSQQGFTLIELLIVVAIIGILAAIAIPQFSAYRMRGYNAAANSDVRNAGTAEEALMSDMNGYGRSASITIALPGEGGTGTGAVVTGPQPSAGAVAITTGAGVLTMGPTTQAPVRPVAGVGIGASANVTLRADTLNSTTGGPLDGYGQTFVLVGKHTQGDRAFARETEATATFQCQNSGVTWVNVPLLAMVTIPTPSTGADLVGGCGGLEVPNWLAM